jgi:hypothetical protein
MAFLLHRPGLVICVYDRKYGSQMALNVKLLSPLTAIRIAFYLALFLDVVFVLCAIYTLTLIPPATTSTFSYVSLVYGVVVVSQHHRTSSLDAALQCA